MGPLQVSGRIFLLWCSKWKIAGCCSWFDLYVANNIINWLSIRAFMSSRLIALDKNPGVHPIGIGEVLIRILGKMMISITGIDVEEVCSVDQLCSGLKAGIEGAVHGLRELCEKKSSDGFGILLVDARNAFNSVNRVTALWNVRVLRPRCSRFLFNTYQGFSSLLVQGEVMSLFSVGSVLLRGILWLCFYMLWLFFL